MSLRGSIYNFKSNEVLDDMYDKIKRITRGQWPYRPAATRAMRNRLVVLYDLN